MNGYFYIALIQGPVLLFLSYLGTKYLWLRRRIRRLNDELEIDIHQDNQGNLVGKWENRSIRIQYNPTLYLKRDRFEISLEHGETGLPDLKFEREGLDEKAAKWIDLSQDTKSGDWTFDDSIYVHARDPKRTRSLLEDLQLRDRIRRLLEPSGATLRLESNSIHLEIPARFGRNNALTESFVLTCLERLQSLSQQLNELNATRKAPSHKRSSTPRNRTSNPWVRGVVYGVTGVFFTGPLLLWIGTQYPPLTSDLQRIALSWSLVLMVGYVMGTYFYVRGRSDSHREFSFYLFCAALGIPLFTVGAFTTTNGILDRSAPQSVPARVISSPRQDGTTRGVLELRYQNRHIVVRVDLPPGKSSELKNGQWIEARISKGFWNEPWFNSVGSVPLRDGSSLSPEENRSQASSRTTK